MAQSYFIWKGVDCRSMGVYLRGPVPIVWPEERVNHIQIPGRTGDLTELEGEDIYNSYIQPASIKVRGGYRAGEVKKWLRGSGKVTFSSEPNRQQEARIIGAVTLNRHSRNLDIYEGEVQFYCQPLKERLKPETVEVKASDADKTVKNRGDVTERPVFRVWPTGNTFTLTVGDKSLTVNGGISSSYSYLVDSEAEEFLTSSRAKVLTARSSGEFPVLQVGANEIGGSGWTKVTIERRERYF